MKDRIALSFLITQNRDEDPPVEPVVPFPALYLEDPRICTAVLERTAVLASTTDQYERVTARHDQVYVDPSMVEWRTRTSDSQGNRLNMPAGKGRMAKHRQPASASKSPWHQTNGVVAGFLGDDPGRKAARDLSDQRALKTQQDVRDTEEKELRLLRLRQPVKPAEPEEKEEVNAINTPMPIASAGTYSGSPMWVPADAKEKLKRCKRCGEDKPRSAFAATGIYGGYCSTCEPIEKAERAAERGRKEKPAKPEKTKRKYTRRSTAPESEKSVHKIGVEVTSGYDHVIKLLYRRDALKLELVKVNEQLLEALA